MKISKAAGAVILTMCAGAASAPGAAAAELPGAPDGVLPAVTALSSQVRGLPDQVRSTMEPTHSVTAPVPRHAGKAGDQQLDFGPLGVLSAKNPRSGEAATHALGGVLAKLSKAAR